MCCRAVLPGHDAAAAGAQGRQRACGHQYRQRGAGLRLHRHPRHQLAAGQQGLRRHPGCHQPPGRAGLHFPGHALALLPGASFSILPRLRDGISEAVGRRGTQKMFSRVMPLLCFFQVRRCPFLSSLKVQGSRSRDVVSCRDIPVKFFLHACIGSRIAFL